MIDTSFFEGEALQFRRQAVGHHAPKGGDVYADYSDISCVWTYHHIDIKEEMQQPPLCQVTVVIKNNQ